MFVPGFWSSAGQFCLEGGGGVVQPESLKSAARTCDAIVRLVRVRTSQNLPEQCNQGQPQRLGDFIFQSPSL